MYSNRARGAGATGVLLDSPEFWRPADQSGFSIEDCRFWHVFFGVQKWRFLEPSCGRILASIVTIFEVEVLGFQEMPIFSTKLASKTLEKGVQNGPFLDSGAEMRWSRIMMWLNGNYCEANNCKGNGRKSGVKWSGPCFDYRDKIINTQPRALSAIFSPRPVFIFVSCSNLGESD